MASKIVESQTVDDQAPPQKPTYLCASCRYYVSKVNRCPGCGKNICVECCTDLHSFIECMFG